MYVNNRIPFYNYSEQSRSISDVEVSTAYISASANRFSRVATSSVTSLVAFGSSNAIALWQSAVCNDISSLRRCIY